MYRPCVGNCKMVLCTTQVPYRVPNEDLRQYCIMNIRLGSSDSFCQRLISFRLHCGSIPFATMLTKMRMTRWTFNKETEGETSQWVNNFKIQSFQDIEKYSSLFIISM